MLLNKVLSWANNEGIARVRNLIETSAYLRTADPQKAAEDLREIFKSEQAIGAYIVLRSIAGDGIYEQPQDPYTFSGTDYPVSDDEITSFIGRNAVGKEFPRIFGKIRVDDNGSLQVGIDKREGPSRTMSPSCIEATPDDILPAPVEKVTANNIITYYNYKLVEPDSLEIFTELKLQIPESYSPEQEFHSRKTALTINNGQVIPDDKLPVLAEIIRNLQSSTSSVNPDPSSNKY